MSFFDINIEKQVNGKICKAEIIPASGVFGYNTSPTDVSSDVTLLPGQSFKELPFSRKSQNFKDNSQNTDNGLVFRYRFSCRLKEIIAETAALLYFYQNSPFYLKLYTIDNKVLLFSNMRLISKILHPGMLLSYSGFNLEFSSESMFPSHFFSATDVAKKTVSFFVTNEANEPIPNAIITGSYSGDNFEIITSDSGHASLYNVPKNSQLNYNVSKSGYGPYSDSVIIDDNTNINVILLPEEPEVEYDYYQRFHVRCEKDEPIENAIISFAGKMAFTNSAGHARIGIDDVSGQNEYTISKSGFSSISGLLYWADFPSNDTRLIFESLIRDSDTYIGQEYNGGFIFYVLQEGDIGYNPDNITVLIAAQNNISEETIQWSDKMGEIDTSTSKGMGAPNTQNIVDFGTHTESAAKICDDLDENGYNDWYLPSLNEFKLIHNHLLVYGLGDFPDTSVIYCTSSALSSFNDSWALFYRPKYSLNAAGVVQGHRFTKAFIRAIRKDIYTTSP